jgi:flagellar basal body-associated protein FliL
MKGCIMNDHKGVETSQPKKWGLLFILALAIAGCIISMRYHYVFQLSQSLFQRTYDASRSKGQVKCSVAYSVGERHYLRLKLAIACDGNRQRVELTRNLPRFKNELLMELGSPGMEEAVKNRDFKTLKAHFVRILNRLVKTPVKNVYIENFFYD